MNFKSLKSLKNKVLKMSDNGNKQVKIVVSNPGTSSSFTNTASNGTIYSIKVTPPQGNSSYPFY